jgi:hypothetical protein
VVLDDLWVHPAGPKLLLTIRLLFGASLVQAQRVPDAAVPRDASGKADQ